MNAEQRKAVEECIPIAHYMADGDEDLEQEMLLKACQVVQDGPADVPRLIYFMGLRRLEYWAGRGNGKSVDNGERRNRQDVLIVPYEHFDQTAITSRTEAGFPDEAALARIGCERFLDSLTPKERGYVYLKIYGSDKAFTQWYKRTIRPSVRRKFKAQFDM